MVIGSVAAIANALDNGQGKVPPMGWNTWLAYGCEGLNENVVKENANLLVSLGLAQAGYRYVNLDDCWTLPARDANSHLQAN